MKRKLAGEDSPLEASAGPVVVTQPCPWTDTRMSSFDRRGQGSENRERLNQGRREGRATSKPERRVVRCTTFIKNVIICFSDDKNVGVILSMITIN